MEDQKIQFVSKCHTYRTEVPNIIVDLIAEGFLDGNDLTVYTVIKRITSDDGQCWMSLKNLETVCGMSKNTIKNSLKKLQEIAPIVNKPLIEVEHRFKEDGSRNTSIITINDVWIENIEHYKKKHNRGRSKSDGGVGQNLTGGGSKSDHKEELSKKNHIKEEKEKEKERENIPQPQTQILSFFSFCKEEQEEIFRVLALHGFDKNQVLHCASFAFANDFWKDKIETFDKFIKHFKTIVKQAPKQKEKMTEEEMIQALIKKIHKKMPKTLKTLFCNMNDKIVEEREYFRVIPFSEGFKEIAYRLAQLYFGNRNEVTTLIS